MKTYVKFLMVMVFYFPAISFAQNCVDFESLAIGTTYGNGINAPGDVIFTENDIPVTVENFEWTGGGGTFGVATVVDGIGSFGTPMAMGTNNVNLGFDFNNLAFVPNRVYFDFTDSGGNENISVNGSPIFAGELMSAPMPVGVSISFVNMGTFYRAVMSGEITSLVVGGQEFALDNVCAMKVVDPSDCVDFDLLSPGATFGNGINTIGEVIFTENNIPVSVEYFEWTGGGGTFGTCTVIDGDPVYGTGLAMWTSNINLRFDFTGMEFQPNWVTFDFEDQGGNENISVNGYPIFAGELGAAIMPPGFSLLITNMGSYQQATVVSYATTITELVVGGQEFSIDNVCPMEVGFTTQCVDFEPLGLGTMYGSGINSPGDVIFTQNSIPVMVDNFYYVGGGSTFGNAEVTTASGIGTGQDMREGNINLIFDFMETGYWIDMVTFDFADYGGHENLSINGGTIYAGELTMMPSPPGFTISFNMSGSIGQCMIQGSVEKLLVGGQEFYIDNVCVHSIVGIPDPPGKLPSSSVKLGQNYPNPLNGQTTIPFKVSERSHITITVYDHLGRVVSTLADQEYDAGEYKVEWRAGTAANGIYFYQLRTGKHSQTKKMSRVR
ncbi:MAG: T9SS type A sorting domain-containing protein [Bacteroidota bacterium]